MDIKFKSKQKEEVINVTKIVQDNLSEEEDGLVIISIPHTTAAILICEDDDGLRNDFIKVCRNLLLPLGPYSHIRENNPNTSSHIFSAAFGTRISILIENGVLDLGTYQNILFLELDGPKERRINIKVLKLQK